MKAEVVTFFLNLLTKEKLITRPFHSDLQRHNTLILMAAESSGYLELA